MSLAYNLFSKYSEKQQEKKNKLLIYYYFFFHQKITAMYIDGNLKGGFQTVKAYAEFCAKFRSWMEEKSMKLWPPRIGEILAQDYRIALDFVNKSVRIYFNL